MKSHCKSCCWCLCGTDCVNPSFPHEDLIELIEDCPIWKDEEKEEQP